MNMMKMEEKSVKDMRENIKRTKGMEKVNLIVMKINYLMKCVN